MIELSKRYRVIETVIAFIGTVIDLLKRDKVIETLYSYRNVIKLSKRDRAIESVIELSKRYSVIET